jgi:hypothetical protein
MIPRSIRQHINDNRDELDDPNINSQRRRHIESELISLEKYQLNHPDDDYDPSSFEMYCDENPNAPECKKYEV